MFYILTYKVDKKNRTIKVNEEQAARIRKLMAEGNGNAFITVGLETLKVFQIENLSAQASDISKAGTADMRRRLINAAAGCFTCKGDGFVDVFLDPKGNGSKHWAARGESAKRICDCQARIKEQAGIEANDASWSRKDAETS